MLFIYCFTGSDPFHINSIHFRKWRNRQTILSMTHFRIHYYPLLFPFFPLLYNTALTALSLVLKLISNHELNSFFSVSYQRITLSMPLHSFWLGLTRHFLVIIKYFNTVHKLKGILCATLITHAIGKYTSVLWEQPGGNGNFLSSSIGLLAIKFHTIFIYF